MRLFTGIDLPQPTLDRLERLLAHLRPTAHLKWSPVSNLHITTKFIGEQPEGNLEGLSSSLRALPKRRSIPISIDGLGWFPNPHAPRVFWAAVKGGEALVDLAAAIENSLEPLGIARETRPYSPHLTLARITAGVPLQPMRQAIAQLDAVDFGTFEADRFHLYLSETGAAAAVYTKLAEFPFAA